MEESQKKLKLAVSIGEMLLQSGGEIYRVQETLGRILEAYGIEDYNVFVVSNGIFATIHEEREDRGSIVRYVPLGSVHLGKIAALNQLSREICEGKYTLEEAYQRLEECNRLPSVGNGHRMLAGGMGCAAFCYIFGGRWMECLVAYGLGVLLQLFLQVEARRNVSKFIVNIIGSAMITALSFSLTTTGINFTYDKVIIGSIVPLVPGMALTTSIRELFNGDYLSGSIHLIDALMTATCIAVGVGAAMRIIQMFGGVM